MSGIVLSLNAFGLQNGNSVVCPNCGSHAVRRWGLGTRNVWDTKPVNAIVLRFYCTNCSRTFRYYPQGVDRSQLSVRIRRLAALLWLMDVSTRDVEEIFEILGISINRMTVWREGQKLIEELSQMKLLNRSNRYSIYRPEPGEAHVNEGISFAISLDTGTVAVLGKVNAFDPAPVIAWLRTILWDQEIEISSLGELNYRAANLKFLTV
jgi:transposase-like protein